MKNKMKTIGVYCVCNTMGICVHEMEGKIIHGVNPVLRWMAGNVVVETDPAENIKPTKAKSPEKIDGIVASIMDLDRCVRNAGGQQGSIYDDPDRGMLVF